MMMQETKVKQFVKCAFGVTGDVLYNCLLVYMHYGSRTIKFCRWYQQEKWPVLNCQHCPDCKGYWSENYEGKK